MTSLDDILGAVRARVEARRRAAHELALEIKAAADEYVAAVEREALRELAEKMGVEGPSDANPPAGDASRRLRALLARVPEGTAAEAPAPPRAGGGRAAAAKPPAARDLPSAAARARAALLAELPELPRVKELEAASRHGRVVVLGGHLRREKLDLLERTLGFRPEWIETDRAGQTAVRKLEGRILDGHVAAVVVLEGLIGHAHSEPIARAARQTGTLLVYGDRAGTGALDKAAGQISQRIGKKR